MRAGPALCLARQCRPHYRRFLVLLRVDLRVCEIELLALSTTAEARISLVNHHFLKVGTTNQVACFDGLARADLRIRREPGTDWRPPGWASTRTPTASCVTRIIDLS